MMPPLMVSVTDAPRRTAPPNSMIAATKIAWPMVRALAPTEEAKELATSLAPMPKAQARETMQEKPKSQVYSLVVGVSVEERGGRRDGSECASVRGYRADHMLDVRGHGRKRETASSDERK